MDIQWYILSFETIPRYRKRLHGNGKILLPLPWDTKARGKSETAPAPQPTKEEARARFAALTTGGLIIAAPHPPWHSPVAIKRLARRPRNRP